MSVITSPLVSREEAGIYIGMKPQTLASWATTGRYNLPFIKVGGRVKYRLTDLENFLQANAVPSKN